VRTLILPFLLLGILPMTGCSGDSGTDAEGLISRETFVEAYYQLRAEALKNAYHEMPVEVRDRILAELELTQEDLLRFVEVRGTDADFMEGIWDEIEARLVQPLYPPEAQVEGDAEGGGEIVR
jgi:hypothetical protein